MYVYQLGHQEAKEEKIVGPGKLVQIKENKLRKL